MVLFSEQKSQMVKKVNIRRYLKLKYKCEKCGKMFLDREISRRKKIVGEVDQYIENEFIPLCNLCGKKWIKTERKKTWLGQALTAGWINKDELSRYAKKEMCERDLFLLIQKRKKENESVKEDMILEKC